MHELAVTESLLEIALRHGNRAKARHISDLYIVIGRLSSIIDDSVQFYWDIVAKGTIAEGALLHFRRLPVKFQCMTCDGIFTVDGDQYICPQCQSERIKIESGDEFFLESIEIET